MTGGALIAALPMYDGPGAAQANDAGPDPTQATFMGRALSARRGR